MGFPVRIGVCDQGSGNVRSVVRALERAVPKAVVTLSADPDVLRGSDAVVLPGQGAFGPFAAAIDAAHQGGLREALLGIDPGGKNAV